MKNLDNNYDAPIKQGPITRIAVKANILALFLIFAFSLYVKIIFFAAALPFAANIAVLKTKQKNGLVVWLRYINFASMFMWLTFLTVLLFEADLSAPLLYIVVATLVMLFNSFVCWLSARQIKSNYFHSLGST